jgi:hypothetical protein
VAKKAPAVRWAKTPDAHDFAAALDYLSLIMPPQDAAKYAKLLEQSRYSLVTRKAKDLLRASGLPLLPKSNVHVAKDLARIAKGVKLSPVLLVRGNWTRPLIIADGTHRVMACEHWDENAPIACVLI